MKNLLSLSKLNQGQLRLFAILCRNYNVSIEETINNLIREYNEIHAPIFLEEIKNSFSNTATATPGTKTAPLRLGGNKKYFVSIEDICNALRDDNEQGFLVKLLSSPTAKLNKEDQIKNLEDTINEISRS